MELGLEQQMFAPYSDIIIMNNAVLTCNCSPIRGYIGDWLERVAPICIDI